MAKRIKDVEEAVQDHALTVLQDAEAVLMKRISRMREGKPRTAAQAKLNSIKRAIGLLSNNAKFGNPDALLNTLKGINSFGKALEANFPSKYPRTPLGLGQR